MSQTRKNTESMKCIFFLQKGANLERQYEDRVQKMLSELREVSRYINYKCCVCLSFCFLVDLPVTILKDSICCIYLLFCNYFVFG